MKKQEIITNMARYDEIIALYIARNKKFGTPTLISGSKMSPVSGGKKKHQSGSILGSIRKGKKFPTKSRLTKK